MANEQPLQSINKAELADVLYIAFRKVMEENDVKYSQRNQTTEILTKEIAKLGSLTKGGDAKIRDAINEGFKKGNSVQEAVRKIFQEVQRDMYNNTKNIIKTSSSKISDSSPEIKKIIDNRESKIRRAALSRYNRLNNKLDNTVNTISNSNSKLSGTLSSLSGASRRLELLTNSLIQRTEKITNNMSWLESATKNISESSKKTSRITNSLITQSIKLDKDANWAEQSVNSLKNSSRRISNFFKKGQGIEEVDASNDSEQDQDETKFINKLVKKLEASKLGGVKDDIFRFIGAYIASRMPGHPVLQMGAYLGAPLLGGALAGDALRGFKGTREALGYGSRMLGGGLTRYVPTKVLGKMGKFGEFLYGAGMTGEGLLGSKLIPGLGAAAFGTSAHDKFKKGDKVGGIIDSIGAGGSILTMLSPLFGPAAPIVAGIGEVASILALLYDIFKPAKQFIVGVFGGLWKWLTGLQGKKQEEYDSSTPELPKARNPKISNFLQHSKLGKKMLNFGLEHGGWLASNPIDTSKYSKEELLKVIGGNTNYEKLSSGKGYSVDYNSMITDIPYGKKGTNKIFSNVFSNVFSKYPELKGHVAITSALGTKGTTVKGKFKSSPHSKSGVHFRGGTGFDMVYRGPDPKGQEKLDEALGSTGMFARISPEAEGQGKSTGKHLDVQLSSSAYNKVENAEKKKEVTKSKTPQVPAGPSISYAKHDLSGNTMFDKAVFSLNYTGRDIV